MTNQKLFQEDITEQQQNTKLIFGRFATSNKCRKIIRIFPAEHLINNSYRYFIIIS